MKAKSCLAFRSDREFAWSRQRHCATTHSKMPSAVQALLLLSPARKGAIAFVVLVSFSAVLLAASFTELSTSLQSAAGRHANRIIRMTGLIEDGDASRLRTILVDIRKGAPRTPGVALATVELSSLGGDLLEGMKLGYLLREFDVATIVRSGDLCLSSCALAFLGGTSRHVANDIVVSRTVEVGAVLGFHNFWLNPTHEVANNAATPREGIARGFNEARGAASLLVRYAASLGVDPAFIARMLGRPPDVWDYVDTAGKFIDLKICPALLPATQPAPETMALNMCRNVLGEASLEPAPPVVKRLLQTEAKRHLLDHVRRNVASLSVKGVLATQLAKVVTTRDEGLVDAVYADMRAAGLALPEIMGPTFEVRGFSAGESEVECIVSLSLDDPNRFDLVLKAPSGLVRPSRPGGPACGRVLGLARDAVLNPEKN